MTNYTSRAFSCLKSKICAQNLDIPKNSSNFAPQSLKLCIKMENLQETINRLEKIVESPSMMSAEDRSFVREIAPEFGVEIRNTRCKDCYVDAALLCLFEARKRIEPKQKLEEDERKYILKAGTDVYFGSVRVNEATITDELAARLIDQGFERKFFVKCE